MRVLKHGDVVIVKAATERRSGSFAAFPALVLKPQAFVVIEDEETNSLSIERVSFHVLRALAPDKHAALIGDLQAARAVEPIAVAAKD